MCIYMDTCADNNVDNNVIECSMYSFLFAACKCMKSCVYFDQIKWHKESKKMDCEVKFEKKKVSIVAELLY